MKAISDWITAPLANYGRTDVELTMDDFPDPLQLEHLACICWISGM